MQKIAILDSHTEGEPTRLVLGGAPNLGRGPLSERRDLFRLHHDRFRSAVVNEPRGSDVLVGALLSEPVDPSCAAGVIFFNNVGFIGMCGHGTIGLIASLAHLGRIAPGAHRIETPVGIVTATLNENGSVTVENVPAFRFRSNVPVDVPGHGIVTGDIAWGGNWFFLVEDHGRELSLKFTEELTAFTSLIRNSLANSRITGQNGEEIDHIELFSPVADGSADSTNFVLCPGNAYDRSPCGTGTSAKLACLSAQGKLGPGQIWRQRGILGGVFEGKYRLQGESLIPSITGRAFLTGEGSLLVDPDDPFGAGIAK